jgi:hypothetical protein
MMQFGIDLQHPVDAVNGREAALRLAGYTARRGQLEIGDRKHTGFDLVAGKPVVRFDVFCESLYGS